jgi:O-antigen/teichoic acid export membrane protein
VLGLWSAAYRFISLPFVVFEALWRVSMPAMSRLLEQGANARPLLQRGVEQLAVISTALLVALAASAEPLVVAVLGSTWREGADAIPLACLGLAASAPLTVAGAGFLLARGDAGVVLRATTIQSVVAVAVALPLLPALDVRALGVGLAVAGFAEAVYLGRELQARTGAALAARVAIPVAIGVAAVALATLLPIEPGAAGIEATARALVGLAAFGAAVGLLHRAAAASAVGTLLSLRPGHASAGSRAAGTSSNS